MCSARDTGCSHPVGSPIRTSPDHSVLTAPRSFSQLATSFFAFLCPGIPTHALSSLTIKFPVAPASRIARSSRRYGFRLRPVLPLPACALASTRKSRLSGNLLSRFTSDLFSNSQNAPSRFRAPAVQSRFPGPVRGPAWRETHLQFFCPSSSSVVKDLSRFIRNPFRMPYAEKGTLSPPSGAESLRLSAQRPRAALRIFWFPSSSPSCRRYAA